MRRFERLYYPEPPKPLTEEQRAALIKPLLRDATRKERSAATLRYIVACENLQQRATHDFVPWTSRPTLTFEEIEDAYAQRHFRGYGWRYVDVIESLTGYAAVRDVDFWDHKAWRLQPQLLKHDRTRIVECPLAYASQYVRCYYWRDLVAIIRSSAGCAECGGFSLAHDRQKHFSAKFCSVSCEIEARRRLCREIKFSREEERCLREAKKLLRDVRRTLRMGKETERRKVS